MKKVNPTVIDDQDLLSRIHAKLDAGKALTPEEAMINKQHRELQEQQAKTGAYKKPDLGNVTMWPSRNPDKTYLAFGVVEVEITDPVTKDKHIVSLGIKLDNTWPNSNRVIQSKAGAKGYRAWVSEFNPGASSNGAGQVTDDSVEVTSDEEKEVKSINDETKVETESGVTVK